MPNVVFWVHSDLGFLIAIRSGFTRRFTDPSLTVLQIGTSIVISLVMGYFLDEATVIVLMLLFTTFFFGVFNLDTRRYLALSGAAALGCALLLGLKYDASQRGSEAFRLELLHFMILLMVLLWMSLLGSYVARLRASMAKQKDVLAAALARLSELVSRDDLTGLHNRRHLMEALEQQMERAKRHGEPFALCILDIDHFKRINDTHGHGVGDEALRGFSERIRSHMRGMDVIGRGEIDSTYGRYGGEEFLLLLPYASESSARTCIDRLRTAMGMHAFETSAGPLIITFSAGIAHFRRGESIAELLNRADAALYRAKTAGRDRVEFAV
ncbi:MAG: GGDEF domain-containing protein [Pseudomonadota bacterium]|nr:GGDEF domain-containing protein [Pseudomonadota bacterium]